MAKRSPILGYNHNVRYRGLVFHVQTEDSGLQNPHLFTHLFHEGVIVSTRKYVYDAGSNEEAIKGLMQAQHKAVMKDLRKGTFDDKIDAYLGGTPGLEPRTGAAPGAVLPRGDRAATEQGVPPDESLSPIEIIDGDLSEPIELPIKPRRAAADAPAVSRTASGDRTIPVSSMQPPPPMDDAPTLMGSSANQVAAAVNAANAPTTSRTTTAQKVSQHRTPPDPRANTVRAIQRDSAPLIEISVDDESSGRMRGPRDTAVEMGEDRTDGVPSRTGADSNPPMTMPNSPARPPSHGAATLPAGRPPPRPMTPPIVTRPADSEAENGDRSERPGQYSVNRKDGPVIREQTGRIAAVTGTGNPATIPAGLGRPGSGPNRGGPPGTKSSDTGSNRVVPPQSSRDSGRMPNIQPPPTPPSRDSGRLPSIPREPTPQAARAPTPPTQQRAPTPAPPPLPRAATTPQVHRVTAPIANRSHSPATPNAGSGVVMTRPAVIVGAPPKPPAPPTQRVRKAREEESRGFGQGLISEKSLDEVILAYLSEDAEDK